jgi:hypothetical protein
MCVLTRARAAFEQEAGEHGPFFGFDPQKVALPFGGRFKRFGVDHAFFTFAGAAVCEDSANCALRDVYVRVCDRALTVYAKGSSPSFAFVIQPVPAAVVAVSSKALPAMVAFSFTPSLAPCRFVATRQFCCRVLGD